MASGVNIKSSQIGYILHYINKGGGGVYRRRHLSLRIQFMMNECVQTCIHALQYNRHTHKMSELYVSLFV